MRGPGVAVGRAASSPHCFLCHRELFVCSHHEDPCTGLRRRYVNVRQVPTDACDAVVFLVEYGAEESETLQAAMPHQCAVLADTAGEGDRIDSAHDGGICPDVLADAMRVDADGEAAALVARGCASFDIAQVGGAGESRESGATVQKFLQRQAATSFA